MKHEYIFLNFKSLIKLCENPVFVRGLQLQFKHLNLSESSSYSSGNNWIHCVLLLLCISASLKMNIWCHGSVCWKDTSKSTVDMVNGCIHTCSVKWGIWGHSIWETWTREKARKAGPEAVLRVAGVYTGEEPSLHVCKQKVKFNCRFFFSRHVLKSPMSENIGNLLLVSMQYDWTSWKAAFCIPFGYLRLKCRTLLSSTFISVNQKRDVYMELGSL